MVEICGDPLHTNKNNLVDKYDSRVTSFLKYEVRNSCGDYYITGDNVVITAPGFSGGYFDCKYKKFYRNLGGLLDSRDDIEINSACLLYYFEHGNLPPLSSPFENIIRVPQCCILEYTESDYKLRSYFQLSKSVEVTFSDALKDVSRALDGHDVCLLYSGGMDSTLFYMALENYRSSGSVQAVAIERGYPAATNGPNTAVPMAKELGIDLEIINLESQVIDKDDFISECEELYSTDFVNIPSPYYAPYKLDYDYVVSGQNMDAMQGIGMARSPGMVTPPKGNLDSMKTYIGHVLKNLSPNIHYTKYWEDRIFRYVFLHSFPIILSIAENIINMYEELDIKYLDGDFEPKDDDNVYIPMLLDELPSTKISEEEKYVNNAIYDDMAELKSIFPDGKVSKSMIRYYHYAHNAAKQISSVNRPDGSKIFLPSNWGPFCGEFIRDKTINDAIYPKHKVSSVLNQSFGISYDELFNSNVDPTWKEEKEAKKQVNIPFIEKNSKYLKFQNSNYYKCTSSRSRRQSVKSYYDKANDIVKSGNHSHSDRNFLHNMVNFEIILQENID